MLQVCLRTLLAIVQAYMISSFQIRLHMARTQPEGRHEEEAPAPDARAPEVSLKDLQRWVRPAVSFKLGGLLFGKVWYGIWYGIVWYDIL